MQQLFEKILGQVLDFLFKKLGGSLKTQNPPGVIVYPGFYILYVLILLFLEILPFWYMTADKAVTILVCAPLPTAIWMTIEKKGSLFPIMQYGPFQPLIVRKLHPIVHGDASKDFREHIPPFPF